MGVFVFKGVLVPKNKPRTEWCRASVGKSKQAFLLQLSEVLLVDDRTVLDDEQSRVSTYDGLERHRIDGAEHTYHRLFVPTQFFRECVDVILTATGQEIDLRVLMDDCHQLVHLFAHGDPPSS